MVDEDLQRDFSIHHSLSLFLLSAVGRIPPGEAGRALLVLTMVEAILEDPHVVLLRQRDKLRREAWAELKADGVPYEERQERLEEIHWPMPEADALAEAITDFARRHPWVRVEDLRPKSVVRDMYERFASFNEYVKLYGLERAEGVLLRYVSQVYKTLVQNVPESLRDEELEDLLGWLRASLARADSSLVRTWEAMVRGEPVREAEPPPPRPVDLGRHPKALASRVRAELHAFAAALSRRDYGEALDSMRQDPDDPWDATRLAAALAPFHAEYGDIQFGHRARISSLTVIDREAQRWRVRQVLCDREEDNAWYVEGEVDLRHPLDPDEGPVTTLVDVRC